MLSFYQKVWELIKLEKKKKLGLNTIFLLLTLVINALGAFGIINGTSQSDVSDRYMTLITPSGMTFSIWSVIYSLLIISLIILFLQRNTSYYQKAIDKITPLFILSCILNMTWIILFSFVLVEISSLFIFMYTIVLASICKQLLKIHEGSHFILPLTFGLYTGWLIIATIVNIAATLVKINWQGFGISDEIWAIIILTFGILFVLIVMLNTKNAAMPISVAWAYFGIHSNLISEHNGEHGTLQLVTLVGMAILIGGAAIQFYKNRWGVLPRAEKSFEN